MKDVNDEALRKYLESTREEPVQDESLDVADSTAIEEAASGDYAFEPANFEQPEVIEPEYRQEAPDEYSQRLRQYKRDIIEERERDLDAARQSEDNKVMQWVEAIGNISKQGTDRQQTDVFLGNTKDKRVDKAQKDMVDSVNDYQKFEQKAKDRGLRIMNAGSNIVGVDPVTGEAKVLYKGKEKKSSDDLTPYQKRSLDIQEKRLKLADGKEERLTKKDILGEDVKNRLSDKEVKEVSELDDGIRILDDIDRVLKDTDISDDLGPYASSIEEGKRFVPFMEKDKDFVKMQQLVGIQLADYVKSISGAQVSEEEAKRLLKNIPNMSDKPGEFKVKLKNFKKDFESMRENFVNNIGKQKKGAKKFKKGPKDTEKIIVTKDGKNFKLPKKQLDSALKQGYKLVE